MLNLVVSAFEKVLSKVIERDAARIERLNNAWAEENSNMPPILDCKGRFHAPCDGYVLPNSSEDYVGRNYDEVVFAKGQYLPVPLSRDEDIAYLQIRKSNAMLEKYMAREKIKVEESLADEIIKELEDNAFIKFGKGKSWEVNDIRVCYLYLSGNKSFLSDFYSSIKDVIENKDKQIYTGEAVEGRVRVKGEVINIKVDSEFAYGSPYNAAIVKRCLIKLDNDSTCYGNVPSNVFDELSVGDKVEFTATFSKSEKDSHHAYYKRPFKMEIKNEN